MSEFNSFSTKFAQLVMLKNIERKRANMRIRIDLKIFIFLALFYITNQIQIYLTIMFFCIIHELGHVIVGLIFKMIPEKIELIPCGLNAAFRTNINDTNVKIGKGTLLELKMILVAMAGPLVSLILAILYTQFEPFYISKQDAIYSNILIFIFNILPIYPLDGGRILKGILHIIFGKEISLNLINKISNINMILLTVISSVTIYYFKNIAIFLVCIFLWIVTWQENKKSMLC